MRENTVETRTSCTEEPLEERNSAEEDNRDDDSCNRRRVRGSVSFLCLFEKNVPSENSAKLRNKKEQEEYPSEMPHTNSPGSRFWIIRC